MKSKLLLFACTGLVMACTSEPKEPTPMESAKANIRQYLYENLNDTASYEPIAFDTLQTYTVADSLKALVPIVQSSREDLLMRFNRQSDVLTLAVQLGDPEQEQREQAELDNIADQVELLSKEMTALENSKDTTQIGYTLRHKYRAANGMGGLMLETTNFRLDKNLKVVEVDVE